MVMLMKYMRRSTISNHVCFNPVKGNVSDSELNAGGGQFDTTLEMNEGVP